MIKQCKECGENFEPKHKDKIYCSKKCISKSWEKNNKDKRNIMRKRKYYLNPKKTLEYAKNWRNKNSDKLKIYQQTYQQTYYLDNEKKLMALVRRLTWNKYGSAKICSLCNSKIKVEHHHFKPYNVDNFMDLCKKCHHELYHRSKEND
jgi:hypothetical protein